MTEDGPEVILSDEPADSEFEHVYRDYSTEPRDQVQHDEDGEDFTMT